MAITVVKQPNYPNVTGTNLVYTVTSNSGSQPQFQFVADITSGSSVLTRIRQFPNPAGAGVFDIHRILDDYLEPDNYWKITGAQNATTSYKSFGINFGEEYGTSSSSSVTLYTGNTPQTAGVPAKSGSTIGVFAGTVDPNNGTSYDFPTGSFYKVPLTSYPFTFTSTYNSDSSKGIATQDYETISFLNKSTDPVEEVIYTVYSSTGTTLGSGSYGVSLSSITGSLIYLPVGPKNLTDAGGTVFTNTNWAYYRLQISFLNTEGSTYLFYTKDNNCYYDRTRIAFYNKYGVWDYFGVNLPDSKTTNVTRNTIKRPFVDFSTANSTYDVTRRGLDHYYTSYADDYKVTSNWLSQTEAEWLSELLETPYAFIQDGNNFVPIVITNSSYVHNTNKRGQKNFQFDIEYQYSNTRLGR